MSTGTKQAESDRGFNVSRFLEAVWAIRDRKSWFKYDRQWGPWFRGEPVNRTPLKPTLYRSLAFSEVKAQEVEDEMREEFIKRAPVFCENLPVGDDPRSEWEWYFMMQHFGAATRLLDWTEGALIALYFAVKGGAKQEDGAPATTEEDAAVWVLEPYRLNNKAIGKEWIIPPSATGVKNDEWVKKVQRWLPERFTRMRGLPDKAVAIEPTHVARRISSQHSCFTIHGTDESALYNLEGEENDCLFKIPIPAASLDGLRRDLRICGINEATIFPDLDGVGRSINTRWEVDLRSRLTKPVKAA